MPSGKLLTPLVLLLAFKAGRDQDAAPADGAGSTGSRGASPARRDRSAVGGRGRGGGRGSGGQRGQSRGGVPGQDAEKPTDIPAEGWKQIVKRAWRETKEDNISLLAAGVAYYGFLALFPALIALVTIYGLVADPVQVRDQVESLSKTLPPDTAKLIGDQLTSIAAGSSQALSVGLAVSVLGALFSASGSVGNIVKAINIAYDEEDTRGFLKLRGLSLLLTLGAVLFFVVSIGLVAVLPAVLQQVGLGTIGVIAVGIGRWVGLVVFVLLALAIVYRYAPDRDNPKFKWVGLGSIVATVLWLLGSAAFSFYITNFGKYGKTYGALAGVVVLLLWLYLTAFIVLFGAEINSETEQQTEKDTTEGPPQPMGERRAVKADSLASG